MKKGMRGEWEELEEKGCSYNRCCSFAACALVINHQGRVVGGLQPGCSFAVTADCRLLLVCRRPVEMQTREKASTSSYQGFLVGIIGPKRQSDRLDWTRLDRCRWDGKLCDGSSSSSHGVWNWFSARRSEMCV
jgi:hypothetical protein